MKIEATCDTCRRQFLLSQIGLDSDTPGRCPFCGARFARHYSTVLAEAVEEAEATAGRFIRALGKLQAMETGFDLDLEGLMAEIQAQVKANDTHAKSA
ncbi:MAG TPA: hypothetical protein VE174_00600 [Actinomycetota bacterium]|nr:hypothetical protein [Actinomycetota bacterium]